MTSHQPNADASSAKAPTSPSSKAPTSQTPTAPSSAIPKAKRDIRMVTNKTRDQAYAQIKAYHKAGHIDKATVTRYRDIIKRAKIYEDIYQPFSELQAEIAQRDPVDLTGFVHLPISHKRKYLRWSAIVSVLIFIFAAPLTAYSYVGFIVLLVATIVLYGFTMPYYYGR